MYGKNGLPLSKNWPSFDEFLTQLGDQNAKLDYGKHEEIGKQLEYEYERLKYSFSQFITQGIDDGSIKGKIFITDQDEEIKDLMSSIESLLRKRHEVIMDKINSWSEQDSFQSAVRATILKISQMPDPITINIQEDNAAWLQEDMIGKLMTDINKELAIPCQDLVSHMTYFNKETEVSNAQCCTARTYLLF